MRYEFKRGARVSGLDAQTVGEELDRIRQEEGKLQARSVLDRAKDPNHVLHPAFEWDDTEAAEAYRLQQAGQLIRSVVVTYDDDEVDSEPITVRAFVNIRDDYGTHYDRIDVVLNDDDKREQLLQQALRDARIYIKKYQDLRELSSEFDAVMDAMDNLLDAS